MAVPVVSVLLDSGALATSDSDITVTLAGTNTPVSYRLSLDALHWESWTVWTTSTTIDLETAGLGGSAVAGLRYVYAQAQNGDGDSDVANASINYRPSTPRVLVGTPSQRASTNLIDIPYAGFDRYTRNCVVECQYYYNSAWNDATPDIDDSSHSGTTQVAFGPSITQDETYVWNAGEDLADYAFPTMTVRMRAIFGANVSSWAVSGEFSLDTTSTTVTVDFPKFQPGENAHLRVVFIDEDASLFDPSIAYISSILNPGLTEQLSNNITMTREEAGCFGAYHPLAIDATAGLWRYTCLWSYAGRTDTSNEYFTCIELGETVHRDIPTSSCLVYGVLTTADGQPTASVTIKFISYNVTTDIYSGTIETTTNSYGRFEFELKQGDTGYLVIDEINLQSYITVPSANTADYTTL